MSEINRPKPTGLYFEEFALLSPTDIIHGKKTHRITEQENLAFALMTENMQPIHIDEAYAKTTKYGQRIVNGILTQGVLVGLSVEGLTEGTIFANLKYTDVIASAPVFIGDRLSVQTSIISTSVTSHPETGLVVMEHHGFKQDGTEIMSLQRTAIIYRRPQEF